MWLSASALIGIVIVNQAAGAQLNAWHSGSLAKHFLAAEPATKQTEIAENTSEAVTKLCERESKFEDALDQLAYAFFIDASPVNDKPEITYVRQILDDVVSAKQVEESSNTTKLAPYKAAAERMEKWWAAVARFQRLQNKTGSEKDAAADHDIRRVPTKVTETRRLQTTSAVLADNDDESKGQRRGNTSKQGPLNTGVLPTACPYSLPESDPYWSQKDSYWSCNEHNECIPYNECRFSDGCKKQYTNRERVNSLRAVLGATKSLLEGNGVTHMLFGGSLIGAYRCSDVLPWDLDTDMAVLQDDFQKLYALLDLHNAPWGTGWQWRGRSLDLAVVGLPGFLLMEKQPGCMPFQVVDTSTGFCCDLFPMQSVHPTFMYSPWYEGSVPNCDTKYLFSGCDVGKCDKWSYHNTLPVSQCWVNEVYHSCPHDLPAFMQEYYGPSIAQPDRPVRAGAAM